MTLTPGGRHLSAAVIFTIGTAIAAAQAQEPAPTAQPPAAQTSAAPTPPQQRPDPVPPENLPRPSTTDPRANLKPGAVGAKAAEAAWKIGRAHV